MNQEIKIPWSKDFILEWGDYKGVPVQNSNQKAWTHTWIDYSKELEFIKKLPTKTKFRFKNIKVTAYFRQSISWVKQEQLSLPNQATILKHEQGHLDLAEEHAKKVESRMKKEFMGKRFISKGNSEQEQIADAERIADNLLKQICDEMNAEWHSFEDQYDKETAHGLRVGVQRSYDEKFDLLRS